MSLDFFDYAFGKQVEGWSDLFFEAHLLLQVNGISGDYVEFGCASGTTFGLSFAAMSKMGSVRHSWAFDSFDGLPDTGHEHDQHPAFAAGFGEGVEVFRRACERHGMNDADYTAVVGFYDKTLPTIGRDGDPADIAFALIDCNLYTSTVEVLDFLAPRLKPGMIVAFDDYYIWDSRGASGERIALAEFEQNHPEWNLHPFRRFHWAGLAFVVEPRGQVVGS